MSRDDAISVLDLAAYCMRRNIEPEELIDKWFRDTLITEEMAGLAYVLMSTAIAEVPSS